MPDRPAPEALDPRFFDHLGEIPSALLTDSLHTSVELIERFAREWAVALAHELGVAEALTKSLPDGPTTARALAETLGTVPGFAQPLAWLLEELAAGGEVLATGTPALALAPTPAPTSGSTSRRDGRGERRFRLAPGNGAVRAPRVDAVREAILEHEPANAPFVELLDLAGRAWPRVAAGEVRGEAVLLGASNLGLWMRYFSNDNPGYSVNNRFAAVAAANRLGASGSGGRVLEVGAGAGSATRALLELLEEEGRLDEVTSYRLTEPAPMLLRRAGREVEARWPELAERALATAALDIDRPWAEQGVEPGSVDLVVGVNVFHVAEDLASTLAEARRSLAPGGWLAAGEALKPRPEHPVAAEMIFLLIEDFREVATDPELRPAAGFLTPELWVKQLEAAGFRQAELVPDVRVMREFYPRFATGVVCGRA
jgi:SAM-dependent methyltransferase